MQQAPLLTLIGAGLLSALLYATAATGSAFSLLPVLLSPLPLFMLGLSQGARAAMIAGFTGAAALGLAGGPLVGAAYFLANALAPMVLCRLAMKSRIYTGANGKPATEWYPVGLMIAWVTGLGIVLMLASVLAVSSLEGGLRGWITEAAQIEALIAAILQAQTQAGRPALDAAVLREQLIGLALPGVGVFWSGLALANGALAQRLLVGMGHNARPTPGLLYMELPQFMLVPLAAGAAAWFLPGDAGLAGAAVAAIAAVPYFCLGLAAVHVISRPLPVRGAALAVLYVLMLMFGWPCLLMAGLGVVEQFAGLRYRTGPR